MTRESTSERDFRVLGWATLWLVGLVVALVTGNLSLYAILSALYFGSRVVARVRALRSGEPAEIEPGGPA